MEKIKSRSLVVLGLLSILTLLMFTAVNPLREAKALQITSYPTRTTVNQVVSSFSGGVQVYVTLEDTTWIRVTNANSTVTLKLFNMSNAFDNGHGHVYTPLNLVCNPTISICVVGYTTSGSGGNISPNLPIDRVVLVDISAGAYSKLKNGFNYTYSSKILNNLAISYGGSQFSIFATWSPNGGGNCMIDSLVYNSTDPVDSHPLIFGNSYNTGVNCNVVDVPMSALGSFTGSGQIINYEALANSGGTGFTTFKRSMNLAGCSAVTGAVVNDIIYVSNGLGNFWYAVSGHVIYKFSETCVSLASMDLGSLNGNAALNSIAEDSSLKEIFTESANKVFVMNETSLSATPISTFTASSDIVSHDSLATFNAINFAFSQPSKVVVVFWGQIGGSGGVSGNQVCVNTAQVGSGGTNLVCFGVCDSSGIPNIGCNPNGTLRPSGGLGSNGLLGQNNVTSSFANIFCLAGLQFTCNSYNSKINGIGYLIILGVLVLFVALLATVSKDDNGRVNLSEIHPAIWIAGIICATGFPYLAGIADGIPFFGCMVGVSAFGALKIVRGLT